MSPEEFRKAEALFQAACALKPGERSRFVRRESGGDEKLRSCVMRLLEHDEAPVAAFQTAVGAAVRAATEVLLRPSSQPVPIQIGAYRILRQIGEGGFGVVYLAEQENPRRTVALKVVRWFMASADALARFEHESHVLGRLQHPGIAQIFEAGVAEVTFPSGEGPPFPSRMPYYTMEYIQGRNVLQFAVSPGDGHDPLSVTQRLELIARVCDALQHAHQNGIIHRDIKPDNILVVRTTPESGSRFVSGTRVFDAQPKLLDFGVAAAIEADEPGAARRTHVGQVVGTPAYMSPEQIRGESHSVDTRSDVYAVGVLIYQLLTGRLPYEFGSAGMAEIARIIAEEPPAPIRSSASARTGRIPQDVEAIVCKALSKDKDRRYQSASELAQDIRRFLNDEPVEAKRDSALYLLRKNVRRYRGVLAAVAAFVVLLTGFAVWASAQARTNRRLADESIVARNDAFAQRDRANRTAEQLRVEISQSQIDRGRALGAAGNFGDAEAIIWREFLRDPDSPAAYWALNELYCRFPSMTTMRTGLSLIRSMALSPDGRLAAVGGEGADPEVWDITLQTRIASLTGLKAVTLDLAFSSDGEMVAASTADGRLGLWRPITGELIHEIRANRRSTGTICFNCDGRAIVAGGDDGRIRIWDSGTAKMLTELDTGGSGIYRIRFNSDGTRMASAVRGGNIVLWNTERLCERAMPGSAIDDAFAVPIATLVGHVDVVSMLAFSPDGRGLISAGGNFDRSFRKWNLKSLECEGTFGPVAGVVVDAAFADDGRTIYAGGWFSTDVWDVESRRRARSFQRGSISRLAITRDQSALVATTMRDIRVWRLGSPAQQKVSAISDARSAAFHPAENSLAIARDDGSVAILDLGTSTIRRHLRPIKLPVREDDRLYRIRALRFGPGAKEVIAVSRDRILRRWNVETGNCEEEVPNSNFISQQSVALSADQQRWVFARRGDSFALADYPKTTDATVLSCDRYEAISAAFSHDGRWIATTSRDQLLRLWDKDGKPISRMLCHYTPWGIAFTPDDSRVLTGTWNFNIEMFDVGSGERLHVFEGHAGTVWGVEFKPNEPDVFASCSSDGTVRLWSVSAGRELAAHEICPGEEIITACFSFDGRYIAAVCSAGETHVLDLHFADACIEGNRAHQSALAN
ncbi:MAG: protein kinase [Phycisphaerae bacterium]|nr:protein kinase [Phycisphaerae bacterium]